MKVIYTSALIPFKFEERKIQYENSYRSLLQFFSKDDIFIVECFSNEIGFFKNLESPTFLTETHNYDINNKGVLELIGIKKFLNQISIKDDYIFKVTGRYKLLSNHFLDVISQNTGYDFYGKLTDSNTQLFTGCFLIKSSVLNEFIETADLEYLEKHMINIEKYLLDFLKQKNKKCLFVDKLDIYAPIFGMGDIKTHIL